MTALAKRRLFEIRRADGRSNSQVLCQLVEATEPGKVFSYDDLSAALSAGVDRPFDRSAVQAAVRSAGPMIGRLHKRAMHNVRSVGYRVAMAGEHMGLAASRQCKANRQLKRGFEILRDTRLHEIADEQSRKAHEGQLIVISALLHVVSAHESRINRHEAVINKMLAAAAQ